ncbi:MAG: hypothetical protein JRI76_07395 [Deltaproteobacteria bacterium]|nr:hypothetical protein [Deltaproteobacteria bacterium]MBW2041843.1 hypothetical protein [Deltaproteobacteria bacterium]MBW2133058.1 hypothetical protein [Deltaproteobacteria bacterium]
MIFSAVFFLSFSALSFEVLLARLFSISQWHHLSFMVISIALLGFAAGGVLFFVLDARMPGWEKKWSTKTRLGGLLFGFCLSTCFSLFVLSRIPFDYFRLPFEPVQALYLLCLYLILGVAFFFAGLTVMIGYAAYPEKSGTVYFANMAGSACGAGAAFPLLVAFGETGAAALSALIPLLPAAGVSLAAVFGKPQRESPGPGVKTPFWRILSAAGIVSIATVGLFLGDSAPIRIHPSPYKALSQTLQFPKSAVFETRSTLHGRVDGVRSPFFRHARGLSLKFPAAPPAQWVAFKDGDHPLTFYAPEPDAPFAPYTLQYAGYVLVPDPGRVLVIQAGGGTAVPCARASGAKSVTVAESNPVLAEWIHRHYGLSVINDSPRAVLSAPGPAFDVIHVEDWGPSLPGAGALGQDYLLTVDAFAAALKRLSEKGVLIVSRRLRLPPADALRLWSTAREALWQAEVSDPGRHIVLLRSWDAFVLIVSSQPLPDFAPLTDFANRLNFDFVFSQPMVPDPVNRYSRFPEPYYHDALGRLADDYAKGTAKAFFREYLIDVTPRTDDRPFPDRFLKLDKIKALYRTTGSRFYGLFLSGEIIVVVVFLEAALISMVFLVLPALLAHRRRKSVPFRQTIYFFFVGTGFMFLEMYFIQAFVLPLSDPVISFVVGVIGILLFSAVGGRFSQKLGSHAMKISLWILALFTAAGFWFLDQWIQDMLRFSKGHRLAVAFALLLPMGLPAGIPFPLGMRTLLETPQERAFAWAANGCASVLTAVAAVQVAVSFGISANLLFAAASYLAAWICVATRTT